MNTILYNCPNHCGERHALTWLNGKNSRSLGVLCHMDKNKSPQFIKLPKSLTDCIDMSDIEGIPEYSTPQARKKTETAGNLQFILMNVKEGEAVERNVELPGVDIKHTEDDRIAAECQTKLAQLKQAQSEVQAQIDTLVKKRTKLEQDERETRVKLREVFTEPLNFEELK